MEPDMTDAMKLADECTIVRDLIENPVVKDILARAATALRAAPQPSDVRTIKEATPAQHFDLPKGRPAQFVRNGILETCQCINCRALSTSNPAPAVSGDVRAALGLIETERRRQISEEGYNAAHDDAHDDGEIMKAGMCYLRQALMTVTYNDRRWLAETPMGWPWGTPHWKPSIPARDLIKAGALFLAERDRLRRINRYHGHVEHKLDIAVRRLAALSSAPAGGTGEPVAWRIRVREGSKTYHIYTERLPFEPDVDSNVFPIGEPVAVFASAPKTDPEPGKADEVVIADAAQGSVNADLLQACKGAAEWLSGWASAEPYLSRLKAAITKAEASPAPSSWQPIETAPKDGTDFLALCEYQRKHHQMVGCFAPNGKFASWPGRNNYHPTHWKPLDPGPAHPSTNGGDAAK